MELSELIAKDFDSLYKKIYIASKTKRRLYYPDFAMLSLLNEMVNGEHLDNPFPVNKKCYYDLHGILDNDKLYDLVYDGIRGYQDMEFKLFEKKSISLSPKEKKDLIREFLEYLGTPLYELYKSLCDDNRIFFVDDPNNYGKSFSLPTLDSYYLCVSNNGADDLDIITTIFHELAHIYSSKFLTSYRDSRDGLGDFLYRESLSLTFELLFYYYALDHHIYPELIRLNRNNIDADMLSFQKNIYYFLKAWESEDTYVFFDSLEYTIEGNMYINDFQGMYYQFDDNFKTGDLEDISYVIGIIKAHELCDSILNSKDKIKIINAFLMRFQYGVIFQQEDLNPEIMLEGVKTRNRELKSIYKYL